jgi:hypothetical protein
MVACMRSPRSTKEPGKRRRRSGEERGGVLARYVESGQTQRVFVRKEGIGLSTLQRWLRAASAGEENVQSRGRGPGPHPGEKPALALLEVQWEGGNRAHGGRSSPAYEVELPCGTRLRLGADFVESEVRRLLALLKEVNG